MTKEQEIKMFGLEIGKINETIKEQFDYPGGDRMYVMSVLSDAQHLLEFNEKEKARQLMNQAKMIISKNWRI